MPQAVILNRTLRSLGGFFKNVHRVNIVQADQGNCNAKFTVTQGDLNPMGDLHDGLAVTLVDTISSIGMVSCPEWREPSPTVNISVLRIKSAKLGDELTISSKLLKIENRMAYMDVKIFNTDNELLAKGEHAKLLSENKE